MSRHVADAIEQIHALASAAPRFYRLDDYEDAYLSPAEVAEQYQEAPDDDEGDDVLYGYSVWDAVRECWVDV